MKIIIYAFLTSILSPSWAGVGDPECYDFVDICMNGDVHIYNAKLDLIRLSAMGFINPCVPATQQDGVGKPYNPNFCYEKNRRGYRYQKMLLPYYQSQQGGKGGVFTEVTGPL